MFDVVMTSDPLERCLTESVEKSDEDVSLLEVLRLLQVAVGDPKPKFEEISGEITESRPTPAISARDTTASPRLATVEGISEKALKSRSTPAISARDTDGGPRFASSDELSAVPPKVELKPLPANLRYEFLGPDLTYHVIVNAGLNAAETAKLLHELKIHRKALGYTIDDLKGISPSLCMHRILMEDDNKPSTEHQRRLNPNMKEVVKKEVLNC